MRELIVDWHIHSQYSRACSKKLTLPNIAKACECKGIDVVATADWTHPEWFAHMKEHLKESEPGMYQLKDGSSDTRFMLVTEISQIYKKGDATRRVHNLVFAPSLEVVEEVNKELKSRDFNLESDGRPILGIDSEELYKVLKDIDERIIIVPAHAWTPWYAIFGSKSGFDSIEECFGEMSEYIYAIETGLSSDPPMNWQLSNLDDVMLISNSDAHSPRNLGREANVIAPNEISYDEFMRILREKDRDCFKYTIEFYPQEGKYHFDGCSNCEFSCAPEEAKKHNLRCPECGKKLTLGVHHRVEELSDRESSEVAKQKIPFKSIVPLTTIIAECLGLKTETSKAVMAEYDRLIDNLADEFSILLNVPIDDIAEVATDPTIPLAIERMRSGEVKIKPGYDGVYGEVSIFGEEGPPKPKQDTLL
jgi:uncharacterized protein (TIGR00375 family)